MGDAPQLRLRGPAIAREIDAAPFLGAARLKRLLGAALGFDAVAQFGHRFDRVLGGPKTRLSGFRGRLAAWELALGLL
jgi:hypothetical protein